MAAPHKLHNKGSSPTAVSTIPDLIRECGPLSVGRYNEFFTVHIKNSHTRRAYARACADFFAWYFQGGGRGLGTIRPRHLAAWLMPLEFTPFAPGGQRPRLAPQNHLPDWLIPLLDAPLAPGARQRLTALRTLFDWFVVGNVMEVNPAIPVRWLKHGAKPKRTLTLGADEWRTLFDKISSETVRNLRDRALIATLTYSFASIAAVLKMKVEDFQPLQACWQLQRREGIAEKEHAVPCHPELAEALHAYIDAAGIGIDTKGWLFRTSPRRNMMSLTEQAMTQVDAWRMIRRRAHSAGIYARIGSGSLRATGITAYLKNGGTLEDVQAMAAYKSPRTARLYERHSDHITLDHVKRIVL